MNRRILFRTVLFLSFSFFFKSQIALAQNSSSLAFGAVTAKDFNLPPTNIIDSNTNAVVLEKIGSIEFAGDKKYNGLDFVHKIHLRIKLLNRKAFDDLATVKIQIYGDGGANYKLDDFFASTYNLDNGKVTETKLSYSDIFDEKISNSEDEKSFTMPNLKEGSIIEYAYSFTSPDIDNLPDWNFQFRRYPCLYNEFKIGIPDIARYLVTRYGVDSFYSYKSEDSYGKFQMADVNAGTEVHTHTWIMKDIPAFRNEDFMSEPYNYLDRIEFTLAQFYDGRDIHNYSTDWKSTEDKLLVNKYFGAAILNDNTGNLNNTVQKICSMDGDILDAAKQIYSYVRDNFTCKPNDDIYVQHDLYDVNKSQKGSVAELNMLLIALLRQRGVKADPVILTTRSYGVSPVTYPVIEKLNYVICMMTFGKERIFLDASDPGMSFGKIPLECYNGHAEIIDDQHSGAVYFYPSDIKEHDMTSVLLVSDDKANGENGTLQYTPGYYESADLRGSFKEKDGKEKYLKELKKDFGPDADIANLQIDSLDKIEYPIKVSYDLDFKSGFDGDIIYFNPVIYGGYKKNPFEAIERKFPIEFPYLTDVTYDFTMDIPTGFQVDELPKSVQANLNTTDGSFVYQIFKDAYTVQLHMQLKLNKAIFDPEDYNSLRDFFAMVVKKQSEQVVFKKK